MASVDENGKVTLMKTGEAIITAYLADSEGNMCLGSEDMCTITVIGTSKSKVDRKAMYTQYKQIVMNNIDEYGHYGVFSIYDANGDEIPELYVFKQSAYIVYTFADNQLKEIGSLTEGAFLYFNPDGNGIVNTSAETISVYEITNDSVTRVEHYEYCFEPGDKADEYYAAVEKYKNHRKNFIPGGFDLGVMTTAEECSAAFEELIAPFTT